MALPCGSCKASVIRLGILCVAKVIKVEVHFPVFVSFNQEVLRFQIPVVDIT